MTDKIQNSFVIKELAMKAAELDPDDATTPPESSFEEAEKYLLRANEIDPKVFENCMLLGDLCAASNRRGEAKQWYEQLLNLPCVSEKEIALNKEAASKLKAL